MIDIRDYSEKYLVQYAEGGFETTLVRVRRKYVLESLARYRHASVLEVGCGLEPLFRFVDDAAFTIVEPSGEFVRNARARRYILRVLPDGTARVTIPRRGSQKEAERFANTHRTWIEQQRQRRQ